MPDIVTDDHRARVISFNEVLATYREAEDLINIGAYAKGSNPQIDYALAKIKYLRTFLKQDMKEKALFDETINRLNEIIEPPV